jgi:signal peptidase I
MEPTLRAGHVSWVDRNYYRRHPARRGDVVLFRFRGNTCVKRIYRAPGERLYYCGSPTEVVLPVREASSLKMRPGTRRHPNALKSFTVPEGCVFVLGDNPRNSEDSRAFGMIPMECVLGRVCVETDATRSLQCEASPPHLTGGARLRWLKRARGG